MTVLQSEQKHLVGVDPCTRVIGEVVEMARFTKALSPMELDSFQRPLPTRFGKGNLCLPPKNRKIAKATIAKKRLEIFERNGGMIQ